MNDEELNILNVFVKGTHKEVTTNLDETSKPYAVRGISKKKSIRQCENTNRDFYYMDTGYFGNFPSLGNPGGKKRFHRIVKNELQHTGLLDYPKDRWEKLVKEDPRLEWKGWKSNGGKILLVLPNPKACNYYDIDCDAWIEETTIKIKSLTDMPIEIRVKGSRVYRNHEYSIYDAFKSGTYATVCFNSIAALESVLYGIPAFITVPCAASPLASNNLQDLLSPFKPDVDVILKHCYRLAYGQFTVEEMANGTAWSILKNETSVK